MGIGEKQLAGRGEIQRLAARFEQLEQVMADLRAIGTPLHEAIPEMVALAPEGLVFTDMTGQRTQIALGGTRCQYLAVQVAGDRSGCRSGYGVPAQRPGDRH